MLRTVLLSPMFLACLLALSACGEDQAAQVDNGGPIQTQENGPVDLRDTADQLSKDAQEAARHVQQRAGEVLQEAGEEADGLWQNLKETANDAADVIGDAASSVVDTADDALGGGVLRDRSNKTLIGEDAPARPADDLGSDQSNPQP